MHLHILGIGGTFMGSLALLARELGHRVTGSDRGVYPPMSTLLEAAGIAIADPDDTGVLDPAPDLVIIGNALSRGQRLVEQVLDRGLAYRSGPQWLAEAVLQQRWVLAVSGTHGKTTTASMLAWILDQAGLEPGFLIGGRPQNFGCSARLGQSPFFVVEADEYDTAFFDKRSKFVHLRPRTLVINNIEFDHADIFADLAAIETQFHHLVRTVPGNGLIVANGDQSSVGRVLARGCWTPVERFGLAAGNRWRITMDGNSRRLLQGPQQERLELAAGLPGAHNAHNAAAALLAARHAGVPPDLGAAALRGFQGVARRLQWRGTRSGVRVFDDFAHHPTAVRASLQAAREQAPENRLVAVLEPGSNTMKLGRHREALPSALAQADAVFLFEPPGLGWSMDTLVSDIGACSDGRVSARAESDLGALIAAIAAGARAGDDLLVMSNSGFGGIHQRLLDALAAKQGAS